MYLEVIRPRPTAESKVTIQHNHLNRKSIIQNKNYKCKNNKKNYLFNFYTLYEQIDNWTKLITELSSAFVIASVCIVESVFIVASSFY